jgi:reactive intermediate/imine deaminase
MQVIHTLLAPEAIGTYSQAIRCGQTVYLSGQIPLSPQTMELCSEDILLQIEQTLKNLSAVCDAAGGSLAQIVKLSVYLTDLSHFPLVNQAMTRFFNEPFPARAVLGINALPRGAQVEMDAIMVLSDA